ncbi:MAG: HD domain-containing protein [Candidatus Moranbacteria bacterium]|nr:HD domain-containing protein [Candidatus Moranbacteria bacterium]
MSIVKEVKKFVKEKCQKPTSKYGFEPFECHFKPMVRWAKRLSNELGGDQEVILVAAWLHDIGSIVDGRENHHLTGVKIARKKLVELDYPENKIRLVEKCILNHRGSQNNKRESLEEKIVAEADVISNFDEIEGIFWYSFVHENKNQKEARKEVFDKLERKWKQLHFASSKKLLKPKIKAVRVLFGKNQSHR